MKFSYRGVNVEDAASMLEVTEREINSLQQGQTKEFRYVRHIPEPMPMSYRQVQSVAATAQPAPRCSLVAGLARLNPVNYYRSAATVKP
jgi:galactokinase